MVWEDVAWSLSDLNPEMRDAVGEGAETLAVPPDRLSASARETVQGAAAAVIDGERERAASVLEAQFHTPCEESAPETVNVSGSHRVECHRYDPDAPGEPNEITVEP